MAGGWSVARGVRVWVCFGWSAIGGDRWLEVGFVVGAANYVSCCLYDTGIVDVCFLSLGARDETGFGVTE